jgi:acetylornithine deacetylase/succinyl-diaminopimelate desuccinylase-like protein
MSEFLVDELKALGASVETRDLGKQDWHGQELDLPPIVLATVGTNPEKKTILVYGHYDVQPVSFLFACIHLYIDENMYNLHVYIIRPF